MHAALRLLLLVTGSVAAMSVVACGREQAAVEPASSAAVPVIVISVDTLRADRLPAYGYRGVTTPAIDALRQDSILFRNAYTHSPLTLPSHTSLLTGLLPAQHGVHNNIGYRLDGARHPSIPSVLRARGYATGAAVSSFVLRGNTGIGPLFDFYDDRMPSAAAAILGQVQRPGVETAAIATSWIEGQSGKPFFFLLHLFEPHSPYEPPEPFRSAYAANPYDGEIAAADAIIGGFLGRLRSTGLYDRAAIILLSDHGEGLNDHGEAEHGVFLYREVIQIPLIVKLPASARKGEVVEAPVGITDVAATILALTGTAAPSGLHGTSLLGTLDGNRAIFSETMYPRIHFGWSELRSLADSTHHFIDAPRVELYDLRTDPAEKQNIAGEDRRRTAAMRAAVEPYRHEFNPSSAIDPEEASKLAALGYLGSGTKDPGTPLPDPKDRIGALGDLAEAREHESRGDVVAAIRAYERVIAANPRLTDAWSHLGQTYERAGLLEKAAGAYRKAVELAPSLVSGAALSVASVELKLHRLDEAARHAELALETDRAAASLILGRVALGRGQLSQAEALAAAAAADANFEHRARVLLAQIRIAQRRPQDALEILGPVAEGGSPELAEFVRGDALARLGRLGEAEEAFRREIDLHRGDREAYLRLAALLILQKRIEDADAVMETLVRNNPDPSSFGLAAQTFRDFGQSSRAARWERRAQRR